MKLHYQWLLVLTVLTLPYLVLAPLAWVWLYQHDLFWIWMTATAVITLAGWPLLIWLRGKTKERARAVVEPSPYWPEAGEQAWKDVQEIAGRDYSDFPVDQPKQFWALLEEVLRTVAKRFHPKSGDPMLEIPVPHLLKVVELVAADLRQATEEKLPGSHIMTISDMKRLGRLAALTNRLYYLYRILSFGINPASSLLREVKYAATGQLMNASSSDIKRWMIDFCIQRSGYYAIQLYSGHLEMDVEQLDSYKSRRSAQDEQGAQRREGEPLRVMLIGQVKAGKSSLLNALFGDQKAAVDVVPLTRDVDPYQFDDREEIPQALIFDTAGYEDAERPGDIVKDSLDQVLAADLILLVVSAKSAAREADRRILQAIRDEFAERPDRRMPPALVALTHIDQLRPFREWEPPYDLANPDRPKAENILDAVQATADDLGVAVDQVIPVCLEPTRLYNVEEALVPAIMNVLDEAHRAKYLRCLKEYREEQYWNRLWQQAQHAGKFLVQAGLRLADQSGRTVDDYTRRFTK